MKTLKLFSLSLLFIAFASIASANIKNTCINSEEGLEKLIKNRIESNCADPSNLLNKYGIDNLKEDVDILFQITPEGKVDISSIECNNQATKEFVNQLLDKQKLNVDDLLTGKTYKIKIKLYYKA